MVVTITLICFAMVFSDALVNQIAGKNFYPYHYFTPTFKTLDLTTYSIVINHTSQNFFMLEPQVFELKNNFLAREMLPFTIAALLYTMAFYNWIILIKILGTIAIFAFTWLLSKRWLKSFETRLVFTTTLVLFPTIFGVLSISPIELISNIIRFFGANALFLSRFHSPIATLPFLLMAIYFALQYFDNPNKKNAVLSGISSGILLYTYFYYILFYFGLIFVLLYEWLENKKTSKKFLEAMPKKTLTIIIISIIVALPYIALTLHNFFLGAGNDLIGRLGLMEVSRPFYFLGTLKYLVLVFFTIIFLKKWNTERTMFTGIIITGIIAMNIQVFIGKNLQFLHWQNQVVDLISIFLLLSLFQAWKNNELKIPAIQTDKAIGFFKKNAHYLLIIILIFGFTISLRELNVRCQTKNVFDFSDCKPYQISLEEKEALDWLEKNGGPNDVVIALSAETNARISAGVGMYVYSPNGFITTASNEEIEKRLGFVHKFFGVPRNTFEYLLTPEEETLKISKIKEPIESKEDLIKAEKALLANYSFHFLYETTSVWNKQKFSNAISGWPTEVQQMLTINATEGSNFFFPKQITEKLLNYFDNSHAEKAPNKINWVWEGEYESLVGNLEPLKEKNIVTKVFENSKVKLYAYNTQ